MAAVFSFAVYPQMSVVACLQPEGWSQFFLLGIL